MRNVALGFALLIGTALPASATDSLWTVWNSTTAPDTARLEAIQVLAWKAVFELPDSGMALAEKQLALAGRIGNDRGRYEAHTTLAVGNSMKSDYTAALTHLQECMQLARSMNDRKRIANTLSNMSNVYRNIGDLPMSLRLLQQSITIDKELGNDLGLAGTYNNIGNIHKELGEDEEALESYLQSAALYDALDDDRGRAQTLMSLGAIHLKMGRLELAAVELQRGIDLLRRTGRKMEMGISYNNLGRTYSLMERPKEAHANLDSARTIFTALGARKQLARVFYYSGEQWFSEGRIRQAIVACDEGLELARSTGLLLQEKECLDCLIKAYSSTGEYRQAFLAQKAYLNVNDSLAQLNDRKEMTRLSVTREFQERMFADSLNTVRERFEREREHEVQLSEERDRRNIFLYSSVGILVLAGGLWSRLNQVRRARKAIQYERDRSDQLLLNILPAPVAQELKDHGRTRARHFDEVSVLFTDFKGFTGMATTMSAEDLVNEIDTCFKAFDAIMERHGIEKIKTIGDAYMAAAGLPEPGRANAREVVLAALEMQDFIENRHLERTARTLPAFRMRAGIHTGPVIAGVVGVRKFAYDIWGDTVNTASRMESSGEVGQVNISSVTHALVQGERGLSFTARGLIQAKGKGDLAMFFAHRGDND